MEGFMVRFAKDSTAFRVFFVLNVCAVGDTISPSVENQFPFSQFLKVLP